MTFEVGCLMVSVVALAVLYWVLDRRVTRIEKLLSQSARVKDAAGTDAK